MDIEILIISVLIVPFNLLAIIPTLKNRALRVVPANIIAVTICFHHLMVGLSLIVQSFSKGTYSYTLHTKLFSIQVGLFGMVGLTIDRFFAIKLPFKYREKSTKFSFLVTMISVLLASVILIIELAIEWQDQHHSHPKIQEMAVVVTVFFDITVLSIVNTILFLETRRHIQHISKLKLAVLNAIRLCKEDELADENDDANPDCNDNRNLQKERSLRYWSLRAKNRIQRFSTNISARKEAKAAYMCIRMVLSFAVLWLPWSIGWVMSSGIHNKDIDNGHNHSKFWQVSMCMALSNSIADPVLYMTSTRIIRYIFFRGSCTLCLSKSKNPTRHFHDKVGPAIIQVLPKQI